MSCEQWAAKMIQFYYFKNFICIFSILFFQYNFFFFYCKKDTILKWGLPPTFSFSCLRKRLEPECFRRRHSGQPHPFSDYLSRWNSCHSPLRWAMHWKTRKHGITRSWDHCNCNTKPAPFCFCFCNPFSYWCGLSCVCDDRGVLTHFAGPSPMCSTKWVFMNS